MISILDCSLVKENSNLLNLQQNPNAYQIRKSQIIKTYQTSVEEIMSKIVAEWLQRDDEFKKINANS